jgi:FkbM family methyltransferase
MWSWRGAMSRSAGRSSESKASPTREVIPLGDRTVAVRLAFGGWAVVPTWNVDVALGMIRDGIIEPWTSRAVQRLLRLGQTYVNVGANFGYYMVLGAHCVGPSGKVFAVEANPVVLPYLLRTLFWSGYRETIRLYHRAASDQDGLELDIMSDAQFVGGASVAQRVIAPEFFPTAVEDSLWENIDVARVVQADGRVVPETGLFVRRKCLTTRLDTLLAAEPHIDLLHMDIEGSEPAAIQGGLEIIRRSPGMALVMEWSPYYCLSDGLIEQTRAMCELFESRGYSWYRLAPSAFDATAVAPALVRIRDREQLFRLPQSDLVVVRDLAAYHPGWPELVRDS